MSEVAEMKESNYAVVNINNGVFIIRLIDHDWRVYPNKECLYADVIIQEHSNGTITFKGDKIVFIDSDTVNLTNDLVDTLMDGEVKKKTKKRWGKIKEYWEPTRSFLQLKKRNPFEITSNLYQIIEEVGD